MARPKKNPTDKRKPVAIGFSDVEYAKIETARFETGIKTYAEFVRAAALEKATILGVKLAQK